MWEANTTPFVADVCVTGGRPCRFLNAEGVPVKPPTDWTTCSVVPVVHIRRLFIHEARIFTECEITDMLIAGADLTPDVVMFD